MIRAIPVDRIAVADKIRGDHVVRTLEPSERGPMADVEAARAVLADLALIQGDGTHEDPFAVVPELYTCAGLSLYALAFVLYETFHPDKHDKVVFLQVSDYLFEATCWGITCVDGDKGVVATPFFEEAEPGGNGVGIPVDQPQSPEAASPRP